MGRVVQIKCKFKEIQSDGRIIFRYGGMLEGRPDEFSLEDCKQMVQDSLSPAANSIDKHNGKQASKAIAAYAASGHLR